jgi:hypothetical protein
MPGRCTLPSLTPTSMVSLLHVAPPSFDVRCAISWL